jgi:cold-inducible RNA-binding protein
MTNIFVANLPYGVTEAQLMDCFMQYGAVEKVEVIRDRVTGQSRGFGFVEMPDDPEAALAIADLDGRDWDGRRIHVRVAEERSTQERKVYQKA